MNPPESKVLTKSATKLEELMVKKELQRGGGGYLRIREQHSKGKLTARERLDLLFDPNTFEEYGSFVLHKCHDFKMQEQRFEGDSVVTGSGDVNGLKVFAFAQDFTVCGGSLSVASTSKICKLMDMAAKVGAPIVGLLDSGGARIQEGVDSLEGCGEIFTRNTRYSGVVPQISVIMGPCAGAAVYSPALTDFIFMVRGIGQMYITGPSVIKSTTGEEVTFEQLGDAQVHASKSGNCHLVAENEQDCLKQVRSLLGYLPSCSKLKPARLECPADSEAPDEELMNIVPSDSGRPYDMKDVIRRIVDKGEFMEVHEQFGQSIVICFARLGGQSVGIVAQQPKYQAGAITVDSSDKAARFVRFCDCFNIPVVTLVDVPGFFPSVEQEYKGIQRHGAKLLYAYAEATVPKVTLIMRKAYGGAYIAMGSKSLHADINYAWPAAEMAVMGPAGAINILYRSVLDKAEDWYATRMKLVEEYSSQFANPYFAAASGHIDDVIDPRTTRARLIKALRMLENKEICVPFRKHGNIPL